MTYDTNFIWVVYGSIEAPRSIERGAILKEKKNYNERKDLKRKVLNFRKTLINFAQFIAVCSSAKPYEIGENLHCVSYPL